MSFLRQPPEIPHDPVPFRPVWVVGVVARIDVQNAELVTFSLLGEISDLQTQVEAHGGRLQVEVLGTGEGVAGLLTAIEGRVGSAHLHCVDGVPGSTGNEAHLEAAARLIDVADVVILAGAEIEDQTDELLKVARSQGCPVVCLSGESEVVVRREGMEPGWLKPDAMCQWLEQMKLITLAPDAAPLPLAETASRLKENLSVLAQRDAHVFRDAAAWTVGLGASAALLAVVAGVLPQGNLTEKLIVLGIGLTELGLVLGILVWKWRADRSGVRDEWSESRFAVQVLKSAQASQPVLDPLDNVYARRRSEWRRFAITVCLMHRAFRQSSHDPVEFRGNYLQQRITNQIDYFTRGAERARRWSVQGGRLALLGLVLAPFSVTAAFANRWWGLGWGSSTIGTFALALLPVILPLMAAVIMSLNHVLENDRRTQRYPDMITRLNRLRDEAPTGKSEPRLNAWVARTEDLFADETMEWYFATRLVDLW